MYSDVVSYCVAEELFCYEELFCKLQSSLLGHYADVYPFH